jgi:peroxiredoxin
MSVAVAAIVLAVVTTPLGPSGPTGPTDPRPTAYIIASPTTGLAPGQKPPEFEMTLDDGTTYQLLDLDGQPIRLADFRGKAVWVNFWTSWCPPCQSETPTLRDVSETYADRGLVLVAINVQETVETGRAYADRYDLYFPIGADVAGHVFRAWRVFARPTQFFIDPEGIVRAGGGGPRDAGGAAADVESIQPARPPQE